MPGPATIDSFSRHLLWAGRLLLGVLIGVIPASAGAAGMLQYPDRVKAALQFPLGVADFEENPGQLDDVGAGSALGLGFRFRLRPNLAIAGTFLDCWTDYDNDRVANPFLGTVSPRMDLSVTTLLVGVEGILPLKRFEPYVRASLGAGRATLEITGSLFGLPGTVEEEKDTVFPRELAAGATLILTRKVDIGLEYSLIDNRGDFGSLSQGSVDLGATILSFVFRYYPQVP